MLAATLAFEAMIDGADRDRAVALARFSLDGDRLWAVDNGLFWVVAANVRMLADDDLGDFWARARAQAHARGSLFMALSTSVWEGYWRWRRGELDEALACLTAALDQDRMWGGSGIGEPYTRSFQIGCHLDRGDVAAARQVADAAVTGPAAGEGGRLLQHSLARLLAVEGRPAEALAALDAIPMPVPVRNPVWNPWLTTAAIALDRLGRTDEAVTLMQEEVARLRRWGAPSYLGTALGRLGRLRGDDGLADMREAVEVLTPTYAAVELARARCMLGSCARGAGRRGGRAAPGRARHRARPGRARHPAARPGGAGPPRPARRERPGRAAVPDVHRAAHRRARRGGSRRPGRGAAAVPDARHGAGGAGVDVRERLQVRPQVRRRILGH